MALSKEQVREIFDEMSDGTPLGVALEKRGILRSAFRRAVQKDFDALQEYLHARADFSDTLAEQLIDIADKELDANKARNMIDVRKWVASKYNPKVYGDRIDVNVTERVDLSNVLEQARQRASMLPPRDPRDIEDAQVIETQQLVLPGSLGSEPADLPESTESSGQVPDADDLLS